MIAQCWLHWALLQLLAKLSWPHATWSYLSLEEIIWQKIWLLILSYHKYSWIYQLSWLGLSRLLHHHFQSSDQIACQQLFSADLSAIKEKYLDYYISRDISNEIWSSASTDSFFLWTRNYTFIIMICSYRAATLFSWSVLLRTRTEWSD